MREFTLYFAGTFSRAQEAVEVRIQNRLLSFVDSGSVYRWIDFRGSNFKSIMIDSGAFSVWTGKARIDLDDYIEYCLDLSERSKDFGGSIIFVNLDVLPSKVGDTRRSLRDDPSVFDVSASLGFKNLMKMLSAGIKPIHVIHQGEDLSWIDRTVEYVDYIGISPANDLSEDQKRLWIDSVFNYLHKRGYEKVRTHGFAVTSPKTMLNFPWTSCDSAAWILIAAYGQVIVPYGGYESPDYSKPPSVIILSEKNKRAHRQIIDSYLEAMGDFERAVSSRVLRMKLNVRYFQGLESFINETRKKFRPRRRVFDV